MNGTAAAANLQEPATLTATLTPAPQVTVKAASAAPPLATTPPPATPPLPSSATATPALSRNEQEACRWGCGHRFDPLFVGVNTAELELANQRARKQRADHQTRCSLRTKRPVEDHNGDCNGNGSNNRTDKKQKLGESGSPTMNGGATSVAAANAVAAARQAAASLPANGQTAAAPSAAAPAKPVAPVPPPLATPVYSERQQSAIAAGVQHIAALFGEESYSRLRKVKINEFDPHAPLTLAAVPYTPCAAVASTYFSEGTNTQRLLESQPANVYLHREQADGSIGSTELGATSHDTKAEIKRRESAVGSSLRLDTASASSASAAAPSPIMITNLDTRSVRDHATQFPGLFDGLQKEAAQVDEGLRRIEDHAYQSCMYQQSTEPDAKPTRWRRVQEYAWQRVMGLLMFFVGGFGITGLQLYLKRFLAFTGFHTEIGFSSAVNLMRHDSIGVAVWFGYFHRNLLVHYTPKQISAFMKRTDYVTVIKEWVKKGIPVWVVYQSPGTAIVSPSSPHGAGHCVVSFGDYIMQSAYNRGFTLAAMRACLSYFNPLFRTMANGGAATRAVLAPLRMQAVRYAVNNVMTSLDFGLEEEMRAVNDIARAATAQGKAVVWYHLPPKRLQEDYCGRCGYLIDLVSIDALCVHCYLGEPIVEDTEGADEFAVPDLGVAAGAEEDDYSNTSFVPLYWFASIEHQRLTQILSGEKSFEFRPMIPKKALAEMEKAGKPHFYLMLQSLTLHAVAAMVTITRVTETHDSGLTPAELAAMGAGQYRYAWRIGKVWEVKKRVPTAGCQGVRHASIAEVEHLMLRADGQPTPIFTVVQTPPLANAATAASSTATAASSVDANSLHVSRGIYPENLRFVRDYSAPVTVPLIPPAPSPPIPSVSGGAAAAAASDKS